MPEVTMCVARHCPKRESCYRYRAIPDQQVQSYCKFDVAWDARERCCAANEYRQYIDIGDGHGCIPTEDVDAEYDRENDGH